MPAVIARQPAASAYDAKSGRLVWELKTAPDPQDPGSTPGRRTPSTTIMGAAPWGTITYDPELKLVYFGTGQPEPWTAAARGKGCALQQQPHRRRCRYRKDALVLPADESGRLGPGRRAESLLVDLRIGGGVRKTLINTGKMGWGVVLDRETGRFIGAFQTAYENVITGWTEEGRAIIDPAKVAEPEDVGSGKTFEVCPPLHGARNLQSPSYSPVTRLYYLGINNACMTATVVPTEYRPGIVLNGVSHTAKRVPGYDYVGEFVAFDPVSGKRAWTYRSPGGEAMTASALATARGIVFGGTVDREFFALDSATRPSALANPPERRYLWIADCLPGERSAIRGDRRRWQAGAVDVLRRADECSPLARQRGTPCVRPAPSARSAAAGTRWRAGDVERSGVAASPAPPASGRGAAAVPASAGPGLFTTVQAARGQQVFSQSCGNCHRVADQTGAAFRQKWASGGLGSLFNVISRPCP